MNGIEVYMSTAQLSLNGIHQSTKPGIRNICTNQTVLKLLPQFRYCESQVLRNLFYMD